MATYIPQKPEDSASTDGDLLVPVAAVRMATATDLSAGATDGDYEPLQVDASGRLHTNVGISALPAGASTEATLATRLSESDFDTKTGSLTETAPATDTASSGTNGRLQRIAQRITSLIALLPTVLGQTTKAASLSVALASDQTVPVAGDIAHDAADSGNPVKIGGQARQTLPTAVADADRVNIITDDVGRQVVVPHAVRDLCADQQKALTSTTAVTTIVTADANNMLDLVGLILTNTSATGSIVTLYDDDGTTVRAIFYCPATDVRGIVFAVPFKQTAVNKAWKMKTTTSIASLQVTAQFIKNI